MNLGVEFSIFLWVEPGQNISIVSIFKNGAFLNLLVCMIANWSL